MEGPTDWRWQCIDKLEARLRRANARNMELHAVIGKLWRELKKQQLNRDDLLRVVDSDTSDED